MNTPIGIAMHQGKVMVRLARNYPDLPAVLSETTQNAIDSGASRVEIMVDMKKRHAIVLDNGTGASQEKVIEALQSIGSTLKDKNRYGQFGLGLISPISVAKEFSFTSCPTPRKSGYTRYTFVTSEIEKQASVSIPSESDDSLTLDPDGKTWWRTKVVLLGITKDRRASHIEGDGLASDIALKYGEDIRRRHISVMIVITDQNGVKTETPVIAPEFTGEKLGIYDGKFDECGNVKIELWLAQLSRQGRRGTITFGTLSNPSRISTKQFVGCTEGLLKAEATKALASGIFEGRILAEKIVLHADRTRFENNDALSALCIVLETWFEEVGKALIAEAEEQASDDRFQRIGTQVMPYAEMLLKQSQFKDVAEHILLGTTGIHHKDLPPKSVIGPDDGKSVSVDGNPFEKKDPKRKKSGEEDTTSPKTDHPKHSPGIVYGDKGRIRTKVKNNSTGLQFEYVEMEDIRIPFEFDPECGRLSFNVRNANWSLCQENDSFLQEYHIAVVTTALSTELFRDDGGQIDPRIIRFSHESLLHQSFAIRHGKALMKK